MYVENKYFMVSSTSSTLFYSLKIRKVNFPLSNILSRRIAYADLKIDIHHTYSLRVICLSHFPV